MMPACPHTRRFIHPSARSFAGRPACAAEALRRLCVATHRLRTAAGVCIVRRIASRPPCPPRPVASTLRSLPRPVRRIVSLPLRPPHCLPSAVSAVSAVSAAPRCIDTLFIPAPRPPHCVSSAASAALPPVRRVRRAPLYRRSVHSRAPSAPGESGTHAPSCGIRRIRGYVRSLRPARLVSGSPALQPPQPHAPPMSSPPCPRPTAAAARPESKISIKAYSGTAKNSYFWWQKNARSALRCVRTERFRQAGRRSAFAQAIPEDGNDREKQQRKT